MKVFNQCLLIQRHVFATDLLDCKENNEVGIYQRSHKFFTVPHDTSISKVFCTSEVLFVLTQSHHVVVNKELDLFKHRFIAQITREVILKLFIFEQIDKHVKHLKEFVN